MCVCVFYIILICILSIVYNFMTLTGYEIFSQQPFLRIPNLKAVVPLLLSAHLVNLCVLIARGAFGDAVGLCECG